MSLLTVFLRSEFTKMLRASSPKYQLDLEMAKKSNFSKLAQNEALHALVTKYCFRLDKSKAIFLHNVFVSMPQLISPQNRSKMSGVFRGS